MQILNENVSENHNKVLKRVQCSLNVFESVHIWG